MGGWSEISPARALEVTEKKINRESEYWSFDKEARGPIEKIGETRIIGNSFYRE